MDINIVGLILTCIIASLAWYVNNRLNTIPLLRTIIQVVIIILAIYYTWGYLGIHNKYIHVG